MASQKTKEKCVVLVPANTPILRKCELGLQALEREGYTVRRVGGFAQIDLGRSVMASAALDDGFEHLMWIDSDMQFDSESVEVLLDAELLVNSGLYPKKGLRALASNVAPGTERVVFGKNGGVFEILYAATGFLLTHRSVYERVATDSQLPTCNAQYGEAFRPFFMPMIVDHGEGPWYLGEDFAFCERVRRAGISVHADSRIRLGHIGEYTYWWEDAGGELTRYDDYTLNLD